MRTIEFKVTGHLPPKKDGANSMWNKPSERARLVALRQAAYACCGQEPVLSADIRLTVEIHCLARELLTAGDLDNFITGVCDGLMAAAGRTPVVSWETPEFESIHPQKRIAISDDRHIVEISARKVASEDGTRWYRVLLQGL
jgi:hypothetical protein